MKRIYVALVFLVLCFGCNKKTIVYEYNGVKITRIDKAATSYFYYGDHTMDDRSKPHIKVGYKGFKNCMNAFLVFNKDGRVELKNAGCGDFDISNNENEMLFMKEYENIEYLHWEDSIKSSYNNVFFVSDGIMAERRKNKQNNSKVRMISYLYTYAK